LGIDAPVIAVGVDQAGTMDVPSNVTEVAWYRFGARPGEPGAAVLAAHVDLAGSGPGVFFHLDRLQVDDLVVVQFEDDSVRSFTVVAAERVPKTDLDLEVLFSRSGSPIVYLVTCGGAFNPQIRRYDDNVVVTLTPAEGRSG
jgi:sortase (surface protein transpeptidase)